VHWLEVEQRLSADASARQPAAPKKVAKLTRIEKLSREGTFERQARLFVFSVPTAPADIVTNIRAGDPDFPYPRYIAGERNAPPEDCGGIPGCYDTLDAAADPKHPNHAEAKKWLDDYDPDVSDELPIKYALGRIAN
jgi:hypothetical protein